MKKIISLVVLFSLVISAQTFKSNTLVELKQISLSNSSTVNPASSSPGDFQTGIKLARRLFGGYPTSNFEYGSAFSGVIASIDTKKSPALAMLYSFLIPGMGELYAGDYSTGKYFTAADGILWGTFAGFQIYGNNQRNNYKSFAQTNAGALIDGKDADYFANIGIYPSLDEYNTQMLLNRNFDKTYNPVTHYWNWINPDQRKEYRDMWTSSESAFTNVRFVAGALILNRIISIINAIRTVSAYNKNLNREVSWNIYFGAERRTVNEQSFTINFISNF